MEKIAFTYNASTMVDNVLKKMDTKMERDQLIQKLQEEWKSIQSVDHQYMTSADALSVITEAGYQI